MTPKLPRVVGVAPCGACELHAGAATGREASVSAAITRRPAGVTMVKGSGVTGGGGRTRPPAGGRSEPKMLSARAFANQADERKRAAELAAPSGESGRVDRSGHRSHLLGRSLERSRN